MVWYGLSRDEIDTLTLGLGLAIRSDEAYLAATARRENHVERSEIRDRVTRFKTLRQSLVDRANAQLSSK